MNARLEALVGLRLEDPALLLLLGLVPLALLARARRGGPALRFAPPVDGLPVSTRARLRHVPLALHAVAIALLIVAAARPVHRAPLPLEAKGSDVLLVLDVSSSMTATDMDPERTRLQVAKDEALGLVRERPHDRFGLLTFARYPDVVCPPTLDHDALAAFLAEVETVEPDGAEDRTGLGAALARAAQLLAGGEGGASSVVILLTDGEENVATAETPDEIGPLPAGQLLESLGVRTHPVVVGRGTPGPRGEWTPLDLAQVRAVAERTGGVLGEARDAAAMAEVVRRIDALEKVEHEAPRFRIEERFLAFLLAGLALGLLSFGLRRTVGETWP
ncbi:MAG: VWA domain-containing protein [Planctomycetota bacterium JB042]